MAEPFAVEWLGGAAAHHFLRARPAGADIPWQELDPRRYRPALVAQAQRVWTDVALSEYAAVAQFSQVVGALAAARAPLDLMGMAADFVTDEIKHVELACRLVMQLGGAPARSFDAARLTPALAPSLTPLQRANELALRIGCIAEPYASGTAAPMMKTTSEPVVRAVYETILRDEALHARFGELYFAWAGERLDDAERLRLARVAGSLLAHYARLWRSEAPPSVEGSSEHDEETCALGWCARPRYRELALATVRDAILPPLRALGLPLDDARIDALLTR